MSKEVYFSLQHSESVVAQMAATIFAAYVQKGEVNDETENSYIQKSTLIALRMADYADKLIKSDEEWMVKDTPSAASLL